MDVEYRGLEDRAARSTMIRSGSLRCGTVVHRSGAKLSWTRTEGLLYRSAFGPELLDITGIKYELRATSTAVSCCNIPAARFSWRQASLIIPHCDPT